MSRVIQQSLELSPPAWTVVPRLAIPLVGAILVGIAAQWLVGAVVGDFSAKVMLIAGINIILAVSLTVVNGFTGQFSMGHAGFMAIGGYVAASIVYYGSIRLFGSADFAGGVLSMTHSGAGPVPFMGKGDVLFVCACLAGGVFASLAGYVVGLPSLRLRGDYLAIVTLGFGEIVRVLLQGTPDQIQPWRAEEAQSEPLHELLFMVGGPKGFNLLPPYTTLFWVYLFVALTLVVCYRLKTSSTGRAFLSIREDEIAAQAMGVHVTRYKVRAFVMASFFAGLAGGLYAMDIGAINAGDLGFLKSFEVIIMVVMGGLGSISGAALAAVILTILPELLRSPPPVWPAGLAIIIAVLIVQARRKRWNLSLPATIAAVTLIVEWFRVCTLPERADWGPWSRAIILSLILALLAAGLKWREAERSAGVGVGRPTLLARLRTRRARRTIVRVGALVAVGAALEWWRRYSAATDVSIADFRLIIYALALVLMMILRPAGLFGLHEIWELRRARRARQGGPG